jgi:2,4-dienoyl-CoA reductase-like NADH-dependent reductase (Old Yellow Enzyme family)
MLTHVHKPFTLGAQTLKNRVFRSAHGTLIGGGTINDDFIAYHEARARGGVALSVLEVISPHRSCESLLNIWDPKLPDAYPRFMDRMHLHEMKVFQQINHSGANSYGPDGAPPWGASDIAGFQHAITPVPMTKAMIDAVVESYAETARKCAAWGADGVELHCAHGYLIAQFLSLNSNKRCDQYGGSWENRCRFMLEVARAVRAAVPSSITVGARFSPELIVGGLDEDDNLRAAQRLVDEGLIDYVSLSLGVYQTLYKVIGGMHEPTGYELATSEPITRALDIPTMVIGRFRTLEEADHVIRSGAADLIGFTRATIADPDLVQKTLQGHAEEVRPCIGCNQGCIGGLYTGRLGCTVNPAVGFESTLGEDKLESAARPRHVLIVGGGPAGMEAARIAALRGHRVILAEAQSQLGGALRFAALAPTRRSMADIITWLEQEVYRLRVTVRLGTFVELQDVLAQNPDAVVVATGSVPRMDGIQLSNPGEPISGMHRPNVMSSWDVFSQPQHDFGRTAVVIDDVGHYEAVAVAEHLASRGLTVTFISRFAAFAPQMETALMNVPALQRLSRYSFNLLLRTRAIAINEECVVVAPTYLDSGSNQTQTVAADTVVFVSHNRANRDLYNTLIEKNLETHIIGDCNAPRFLAAAIREGHLIGRRI